MTAVELTDAQRVLYEAARACMRNVRRAEAEYRSVCDQRSVLFQRLVESGLTIADVARLFGLSHSAVSKVVHR